MSLWSNTSLSFISNGKENHNMEDSFLYFGYGSGLNPTIVEFRVNAPILLLCKGKLRNYAFKFNRLNPDGSARGNLCPVENEETLGLIYQISKSRFELLTMTEPEYDLVEFDVETEEGVKKAFAFICKHTVENIYPEEKYLNHIIEYTINNNFPEEYIQKIKLQAKAK